MKNNIFVGMAILILATVVYAEKPDSHNAMWQYTHGMKAKQDISSCTACHANEKACLDCHKVTFGSKKKPRSHKGDYTITHRLDAKRDASTCSTCHERGSNYCQKCHTALGKAPAAAVATAPQSHSDPAWREGGLHGSYAKRNLSACQTCHPNSYTVSPCTSCHGGSTNIAGSPHPANFKASQFKDLTVCYKCHGAGTAGPAAGPLII